MSRRAAGAWLVAAACYAPALVGIVRLPEAMRHRPGVDRDAMVPVMERMQGPNLALLGPLIAAFFAGSFVVALGAARAGLVARWCPWLFALAPPALALGGGLALLACVSASQAWLGAALLRGGRG